MNALQKYEKVVLYCLRRIPMSEKSKILIRNAQITAEGKGYSSGKIREAYQRSKSKATKEKSPKHRRPRYRQMAL